MNSNKTLTIGVAVALVAGVLIIGSFFLNQTPSEQPVPQNGQQESTAISYNSSELGISFEYPENYMLQTHEQGTAERDWTVLTLIDSEILRSAIENGASEGPPAIAIQVFNNPEGYTAEEWIKGMSYSNFKLSSDEVLTPVTVGGEAGLAYRHSGLFENNAAVVVRGEKVYMFSVSWLTPQDENVRDFGHILETINFN